MNLLLLALLAVTPLSVRDSGAKGDGTANDGPAIQAALSSADWVYLPAGTYLTGQKLTLATGQRITFAGGATLKPIPTVGKILALLYVGGVSDALIEGPGGIDGGAASNPTSQLFGVQIDSGAARITIRGLTIQNMASDGTGNTGGDGIYVGQNTTAFFGPPRQVLIDGCRLTGNQRNNISITSGSGIKIVNSDCLAAKFGSGIDVEPNNVAMPVDDVSITGNTLRNNPGGGISLGATGLKAIVVTHATVTGNRLMGNGDATTASLVLKTTRDAAVHGNTIDHSAVSAAVQIADCRRLSFAANTVQGGTMGVWVNPQNPGLTRNVTVTGNTILNQSQYGICEDSAANTLVGITFTGNAVSSDPSTAGPRYTGIELQPGAVAVGNLVNGAPKP